MLPRIETKCCKRQLGQSLYPVPAKFPFQRSLTWPDGPGPRFRGLAGLISKKGCGGLRGFVCHSDGAACGQTRMQHSGHKVVPCPKQKVP